MIRRGVSESEGVGKRKAYTWVDGSGSILDSALVSEAPAVAFPFEHKVLVRPVRAPPGSYRGATARGRSRRRTPVALATARHARWCNPNEIRVLARRSVETILSRGVWRVLQSVIQT